MAEAATARHECRDTLPPGQCKSRHGVCDWCGMVVRLMTTADARATALLYILWPFTQTMVCHV